MSKQTYMMVIALILLLLAPIAQASDTLYYHHDAMGSVVATTDASGAVVWSDDYQGYGNTVSETYPEETTAGFTGQLHSHGGRYYYGARWYDPHIGRFLEIDPAGIRPNDVFSVNRYAYVNNNPYKYVDPDGRVPIPLIMWAGKELIGAVIEYNTGVPATTKGFLKAGAKLVPLGAKKGGGGGDGGVTNKGGTETVQRWMSNAELKATQETGLLRGGRDGTHYVTDSANSNALRARQRSALPQTPEVKVTLEVPAGKFSPPSKVEPAFNMPGGGMERTATGNIPVTIKRVQ